LNAKSTVLGFIPDRRELEMIRKKFAQLLRMMKVSTPREKWISPADEEQLKLDWHFRTSRCLRGFERICETNLPPPMELPPHRGGLLRRLLGRSKE
jgi:hypothetical protein